MDKKQIAAESAKILLYTKSVLFSAEEPFRYASGNVGPVYIDCRRLLSFPDARSRLMDFGSSLLKDLDIDIVAGAETAGIPYGAFIAERLNKPMIYVRKKAKGHGRMSQIEGHLEEGSHPRVLLVEDLQNFGASKQVFVDALRNAGTIVENFFVVFDYGIRPEVIKENEEMGLTLHNLANWWDVLSVAKKENYFDPATLNSVELYLGNSEEWAKKRA